jgi:hypothetical protein
MPPGVVLLDQVAAHLQALEVACNRCDRRGRLRTARLLVGDPAAMAFFDDLISSDDGK